VVGGAAEALSTFRRQGVRLVLSGHLHVGDVSPLPVEGAAPGALSIVLAATAVSRRLRGEPNAFNEITIGPDGRAAVFARAWTGRCWAPAPAAAMPPAAVEQDAAA
jgi:hypothetical protein